MSAFFPRGTSDGIEETPFNMALIWYVNISDIIREKDRAYMDNNINSWYKCLNRLYNKIIFKLAEEEEAELEEKFNEVKTLIRESGSKRIISDKLQFIDMKLIKLMDKYKMIFPKITNIYGLDKIRQKYGIAKKEEVKNE